MENLLKALETQIESLRTRLEKHGGGSHDQSSHGNWATGGSGGDKKIISGKPTSGPAVVSTRQKIKLTSEDVKPSTSAPFAGTTQKDWSTASNAQLGKWLTTQRQRGRKFKQAIDMGRDGINHGKKYDSGLASTMGYDTNWGVEDMTPEERNAYDFGMYLAEHHPNANNY